MSEKNSGGKDDADPAKEEFTITTLMDASKLEDYRDESTLSLNESQDDFHP